MRFKLAACYQPAYTPRSEELNPTKFDSEASIGYRNTLAKNIRTNTYELLSLTNNLKPLPLPLPQHRRINRYIKQRNVVRQRVIQNRGHNIRRIFPRLANALML